MVPSRSLEYVCCVVCCVLGMYLYVDTIQILRQMSWHRVRVCGRVDMHLCESVYIPMRKRWPNQNDKLTTIFTMI